MQKLHNRIVLRYSCDW